jgi:cell division protein FtsI/penicillin-binding protein 2
VQAAEEHWEKESILPHRGAIRDRHGHPLAITTTTFDISLHSGDTVNPEDALRAAKVLSPVVGKSVDQIIGLYNKGITEAVPLKTGLSFDAGIKLEQAYLPGVEVVRQVRRSYPEGNLAAQLIGFVGKDQRGLSGIEADFNRELGGRPGQVVFERDTEGRQIPVGNRDEQPPTDGSDLILTIDRFVQRLIERELENAVTQHKAAGGTIIVMEPETGAILGLANRPTFDLTNLNLADERQMQLYRNRAITDLYEPGSIFKVFTMAAGLQEKRFSPTSAIDCKGYVVKYGWPIRTWDGSAHGRETMTDVLIHSCNVGAVWASDQLGPDLFYRYVADFGFGQPSGVDLGGEAAGQVRTPKDKDWSPIDLSTNSFGQGLNATPLQVITGINAIANGGKLMRPYVVSEVQGPTENRRFEPVMVRQVISPETARTVTEMMNAVVEKGENKMAVVPGYHVAGKTGTAQISSGGGYTSETTIASFAGFGPLDHPRFTILIKIDEPKDSPWGGMVASPIFRSIAEQLFVYMNIPPSDPGVLGKTN